MRKQRQFNLTMLSWLLFLVGSSCTTEDQLYSPTNANVTATFSLKSPSAFNGKITIREAYMKLDRVQVTGNHQTGNTDVTHVIPAGDPPFQLSKADSNRISFTLPFRIYDQLDFHLFLYRDTYELVFEATPVENVPDSPNGGGSTPPDSDGQGDSEEGQGNNESDDAGDDSSGEAGDNGEDEGDSDEGDSDSDMGEDDDNNENEDSDQDDDGSEDEEEGGNADDKKDGDKKDKKKDKKKEKDDDRNDDDKEDDGDDEDEDKDGDKNDDGRSTGTDDQHVVNLDHFFQNAKPGLVVIGSYENNNRIINLIFVASDIPELTVRARQNDSFNLVLNDKNSSSVTFDPEKWFEGLAPADIESGQTQVYQQQEVLFIHPDINSQLYQALAPRLQESADLSVDASTNP